MIIHNPSFAAFCGVLRCFAVFCGILRRFAAFCGVLWRFVAFCSILQRFAAFCGVLWSFVAFWGIFGNKFLLRDQIFGGAQTPAPFSGRSTIIVPKWGGSGPLSPPENIFSGFFLRTTSRSLFLAGEKVPQQRFLQPHHNHLTSINCKIVRCDDGNVLIAQELLDVLGAKISWGLLMPW